MSSYIDNIDYSEVKLVLAGKAAFPLNVTTVYKNQKTLIIWRQSGFHLMNCNSCICHKNTNYNS